MTLLDQIRIAQRNAGESVVMAHLQSQGLIPAHDSNDQPSLQATITRLQGENKVLRDLLTLALDVLQTIVPESAAEDESLDDLTTAITEALKGPQ